MDLRPFYVVECEGFKNLIHSMMPNYVIPNRTTFSRTIIPILYKKCKTELINLLKQKLEGVSFTTDYWSAKSGDSFLSLTINFIDD